MRRIVPFLAGLVLAAFFLPPVHGQPRPRPGQDFTFSLPTLGLLFVDSEAVHKELHLTPAQVEKLKALQTNWFTGYSKLRPSEMKGKAEELSKAAEKGLADVLDEKQCERLRQITLQEYARMSPLLPMELPEVETALKLTDALFPPPGASDDLKKLLTAEQYATWSRLIGAEFKEKLTPSYAGQPMPAYGFPRYPEVVQALLQPSVRAELKMTEEATKKILAARDRWIEFVKEYPDLPGAERKAALKEKTKAAEELLASCLGDASFKRLRQISNRLTPRMRTDLDPVGFALLYDYSSLGEQLQIEKSQHEAARKIQKTFHEAERKLILSEKSAAEVEAGLKKLDDATTTSFHDLLTADQKKRLPDLLGEPFVGEIRELPGASGAFGQGGFPQSFFSTPQFVNSQAVSLIASQPAVREELKLNKEKLEEVREIQSDWMSRLREARRDSAGDEKKLEQALDDLNKDREKKLTDLLGADTLRRARQIAMQFLASRPVGILGHVGHYPEIAERLKLTGEQKNKLSQGQKLESVLTANQKATWKELIGTPFTGKIETPGMGVGTGASTLYFLINDSVRKELKLSDEQTKKVVDLLAELGRLSRGPGFPPPTPDPEEVKKVEDAARAVLKPEQQTRLDQLLRQTQSTGTELAAFLISDTIRQQVALSDDEVARLKTLMEDTPHLRDVIDRPTILNRFSTEAANLDAEFSRHQRARMLAVLNPKQQQLLKNLLGEPLEGLSVFAGGTFPRGPRVVSVVLPPGFLPR
jgi:hypothetical protein